MPETNTLVPEDNVSEQESTSDTAMVDAAMAETAETKPGVTEPSQLPNTTTKDRTLREFLGMMDQYAPIV